MGKFTFGTDPEFMLTRNKRFYSAIPILGRNNENPHRVGDCDYYYDNVLAECSVKPANSKEEAVNIIGNCLNNFAKLVHPYKIKAQASVEYPKNELKDEDALRVGCRPEICAYDVKQVDPPEEDFLTKPLRTAGGHVHIGHKFATDHQGCLLVIRMCDLFLGIPSIFLDHDPTSPRRKALYGKAGRFRKPPYGAEYRSMGNFWLTSPKLVELVYDICDFIVEFVEKGEHNKLCKVDLERLKVGWLEDNFDQSTCYLSNYDVNGVREAIDTMDKVKGEKHLNFVKSMLPSKLSDRIDELSNVEEFNLYKEWRVKK